MIAKNSHHLYVVKLYFDIDKMTAVLPDPPANREACRMPKSPGSAQGQRRYHHGDLRRTLIEAAEKELEEKGVEGFTLRGCAKRAGVSHAAPAHHFKDANALLSALAAEGFSRFARAIEARQQEDGGSARARMIAAGLAYIDFGHDHPAMLRLMFASSRPDHETAELEEQSTKAFTLLVKSVEEMLAEAGQAGGDPRPDIAATWAIVHGLTELGLSGRLNFLPEMSGPQRSALAARIIDKVLPKSEYQG
jgi:AcrR family transcriptional regulator